MNLSRIFFLLFFLTSNAFACLKLEGVIEMEQERLPINQKMELNKELSFLQKNYLYHFKTIRAKTTGAYEVKFKVQKKEGTSLKTISNGQLTALEGQSLRIELKEDQTKELSTIELKLTHI